MPNFKRILPVIALMTGLGVAVAGQAFAGPNAAATWTATLDKSTDVKAGDTVTLTIAATGLNTCSGFTLEAIYNDAAFGDPTTAAAQPFLSPGKTAEAFTTLTGYNRRTVMGAAQLGGSTTAAGSTTLGTFAFVTKAGFTTGNIAIRQVILNSAAQRDTIVASPSPRVLQVNPPPPPAPAIALSDTLVRFDTTRVGSSSQKTFTVSNTGGSALIVTGITVIGRDSLQFTASPTGRDTIAAGGRRTVTVRFAPTSEGAKTATLSIAHNATGSPSRVSLAGVGSPPPAPVISVSDTLVRFDTTRVGFPAQKTFTISNTGGSALIVTGITVVGRDSVQFTASPTRDTIAAGGRRTVTVTFAPTSDGAKTATLSIAHNATGSPSRVSLAGVGARKVDVGPPKVETTNNKQQVVSASFTNSPTDSITWTVSGNVAGTNLRIVAINGDTALARRLAPSALTTTAVTFKTPAAVAGASTITLGAVNPVAATGPLTATVVAESGGLRATSQVSFSVPVPAELSAFAGSFADSRVQLSWTTVSQTNNAGWRVLRSTDNVNFEVVSGIIPGAGTSNERLDYGYTDVNLPNGVDRVYYILEQVDLDGKVTRSRVAEVLLGGRFADMPKEFSTAVYPNPFNPATTIAYNLPEAAKVSIVIYDAIGQEVRTLIGSAETAAGRYTVQWDARDNSGRQVASGVYFAHVTAGKFSGKQKMLLLK